MIHYQFNYTNRIFSNLLIDNGTYGSVCLKYNLIDHGRKKI